MADIHVLSGSETMVTAPLASIPGSDPSNLVVVSAGSDIPLGTNQSQTQFVVPDDKTTVVAVMDTKRNFGWTAVAPAWFTTGSSQTQSMGSVRTLASDSQVGPLSTAVQMVFSFPGIFAGDPQTSTQIVNKVKALPEVKTLASALQANASNADPLSIPEIKTDLNDAVAAAIIALGPFDPSQVQLTALKAERQKTASNMSPQALPTQAIGLDPDTLAYSVNGLTVTPKWGSNSPLFNIKIPASAQALTWVGEVYQVDTSKYATGYDLTSKLNADSHTTDIALTSPTPVGSVYLMPSNIFEYLDIIGDVTDFILDKTGIPGAQSSITLPDKNGFYLLHMYTCSAGWFPGHVQNTKEDFQLMNNWPSPAATKAHRTACIVNALQLAMDAGTLITDILTRGAGSAEAEQIAKCFTGPEVIKDLGGYLDGVGNSDAAAAPLSVWDVVGLVIRAGKDIGEAALACGFHNFSVGHASKAAQSVKVSGLFNLTAIKNKVLSWGKKVGKGTLGIITKTGDIATRLTDAAIITPWEGARIWVGSPWASSGVPQITHVNSDNTVTGSPHRQTIKIFGGNFAQGATVTLDSLSDNKDPYPADPPCPQPPTLGSPGCTTFISSSEVDVWAGVDTQASQWTATVTNPDGLTSAPFPFSVTAPSTGPSIAWVRQTGTSAVDEAYGVATDSSGNVYVVGYTFGSLNGQTNQGSRDLFVIKYQP